MGTLLTSGSVLAAFFAGGVALFAPCCIVFLAPGYLALAARNRRSRLLPLTFVFTAGLALVLVPITLGVSLAAASIARFHAPLYYTGGALMLTLAALTVSGRMWSMPRFLPAPDTSRGDSASFFALGVFSGIASSCCAPVLAGVMTLSALSGSAAGGTLLGLAYVFGMVFPLFVMALAWDRFHLGQRRPGAARPVRLRAAGHTIATNTINLTAAAGFTLMAGFIFYLAGAGQMTGGPGFQAAIGHLLARLFHQILVWTAPVPEAVLGLALLTLAAVFVIAALRGIRNPRPDDQPTEPPPFDADRDRVIELLHAAVADGRSDPAEGARGCTSSAPRHQEPGEDHQEVPHRGRSATSGQGSARSATGPATGRARQRPSG